MFGVGAHQFAVIPIDSVDRVVSRSVDQHEPRFVIGAGAHAVIVGGANVNRWILNGLGAFAKDGIKFVVVVSWEGDIVMSQSGRATLNGQEQHKSSQGWCGAVQASRCFFGSRVVEHAAVNISGVGIGNDQICVNALAVINGHPGDLVVFHDDAGN